MFLHNIPEVLKSIDVVTSKDMPYASALALTWTAQDIQKDIRDDLPKQFIIRNTFASKGVRITPAKKTDFNKGMHSEVYDIDDWLTQHEEGGEKRPKGRNLTIPQSIRRNSRTIIKRLNRARAVLERDDTFRGRLKGRKHQGIYQRLDKPGRKRKNGKRLKKLYSLSPSATLKKRLGFVKKAHNRANRATEINFARAINRVLGY